MKSMNHDDDHHELTRQGRDLAVLAATVESLKQSVESNTEALKAHAQILNEYSGARKAVHWFWMVFSAAAAFFAGKELK